MSGAVSDDRRGRGSRCRMWLAWPALAASALFVTRPVDAQAQQRAETRRQGTDAASAQRLVEHLADEYVASYSDRHPESATMLDLPGAPSDAARRLTDNAPAALGSWHRHEDRWRAALADVDLRRLDERGAWLAGLLREQLEASRRYRVCRVELWSVSHVFGWQTGIADLAAAQPVGSDLARSDALARLRDWGRYVDGNTANLRAGLRLGYRQPRPVIERVVKQLDGILALPDTVSPFVAPLLARDQTAAFRDSALATLRTVVLPAVRRQRDYLRTTYLSRARRAGGVGTFPDGAECYRAAIRYQTGLNLDARSIYRRGQARMDSVQGEMRSLALRAFETTDVPGLFARFKRDSAFRSREEVLSYNRAVVDRARAALPRAFGVPFAQRIEVQPFPTFQEETSPDGEARFPPVGADSTVPGVYRVNTAPAFWVAKYDHDALAFHEALPGHLLNGAAMRRATHPLDNVFANSPGANAFLEGWALYAEGLAHELGLYSNAMQEMGRLGSLAFRAARLVVDPGIHVLGWDREQAIAYMMRTTGAPRDVVDVEVDRYASMPAQAAAYLLGEEEIRRVRARAERRLGTRFDRRTFHDALLAHPAVPLPLLERLVDDWIGRQEAGGRAVPR